MRSTFYAIAALLLSALLPIAAHAAPPSTQCVSTAVAGGTSDAITIPQLPCIPTTTLLILSISLTNTTTTPTISEAGGATQTILRYNGQAIQPGDLTAGAHVELANNGLNWFLLTVSLGVAVDVREFGAKCGSSDSTAALQTAVNAQAGIGAVMIPCPISIGGTVTLPGSTRLSGGGPVFYPGMSDTPGPSEWPPVSGPAISCTNTTVAMCLQVAGIGTEINGINFGNPQPRPPNSGTWVPKIYPYVIGTTSNSGWQGLYIHDVSCTACSHFIDLEGTPDYTTFSANQITIEHLWCNACLENAAIRLHRIDNYFYASNWNFIPQYYGNIPSMGAYQRLHAVSIDMAYVAAPQFNAMSFFAGVKSAITAENDTVTNNFGTLTFAVSAAQFINTQFNQVCQAVTLPNGNGTIAEFYFTTLYVWGDQSGFNCSAGKAMFDLPSNYARLFVSQVGAAAVDTFANVGCGSPGVGSCPAGSPGGSALTRFDGMNVDEYSAFSPAQPFLKAPAGTDVSFGATELRAIRPAAGGGNIMAPGLDGSQAYMAPFCVGGGTNNIEGAVCLSGSGAGNNSGATNFYDKSHVLQGFVGAATADGVNINAVNGSIFFNPKNGASSVNFGSSGGDNLINVSPLPTSPPSGVGGLYVCVDNAGNLYMKSTCP